ncbi:o-succinylbenzoate synthase [Pleurocapsa sp. PCC 7319]|uniref:o-succinylbenzoate synthase n=1 Tax=Pleurocapsa sp. PCC 7319 TaxID=118161 RepID=UPI00034BDA83|nr:o-succinylbenzoate synthase [Pleurocapsa sp. PCC 7319]
MDERFKFKFDIYQRRFKYPLRTSYGVWKVREGIIISLEDRAGKVAQGEIAPLSWFGSETMTQALEFCQHLGKIITVADIAAIPDRLPACQFAFESAWLDLIQAQDNRQPDDLDYCYLLPAGEQALTTWQEIYQTQSATTFKWKIGVYPLATEIEILQQLVSILPPQTKLRLDANGGLNLQQARKLLEVTDTLKAIEFVEQPLPPNNFAEILQLSQEYSTSLALDESVASYEQLKYVYQRGWRGVFVIKAAIMGFPSKLNKFCQDNSLDIVFSSVFETKIGRCAILKLAQKLYHPRAVGFGVNHLLNDSASKL